MIEMMESLLEWLIAYHLPWREIRVTIEFPTLKSKRTAEDALKRDFNFVSMTIHPRDTTVNTIYDIPVEFTSREKMAPLPRRRLLAWE